MVSIEYTDVEKTEMFMRYYNVQMMGIYNMITEADKAMEKAKLTQVEYYYVQDNYDKLHELAKNCDLLWFLK